MRASQQALLTALQADQKQIDAAMVKAQQAFGAEFTSAAAIEDMSQAARLSKDDPAAQEIAIGLAVLSTLSRRSDPNIKGDKLVQSLPDTQRKDAQEFLARLQSLSASTDKPIAVSANVYLGAVRMLMQTPEEALPPLRHALQLSHPTALETN